MLIASYESLKLEDIRNTTIFKSNLLLDDCFINIYKNCQKNSVYQKFHQYTKIVPTRAPISFVWTITETEQRNRATRTYRSVREMIKSHGRTMISIGFNRVSLTVTPFLLVTYGLRQFGIPGTHKAHEWCNICGYNTPRCFVGVVVTIGGYVRFVIGIWWSTTPLGLAT